jgi:glycosyltransferase involved in cell wall biosynthesis
VKSPSLPSTSSRPTRRREGADDAPLVSIVIPCLNEEGTIGMVIREARQAMDDSPYSYEVLVADNGSIDGSPSAAAAAGADVVPVDAPGYGAAVLGGVRAARGEIVVFGDADFSYDFRYAPELIARLLRGDVQMVMGNRLHGEMEAGAMPAMHRYLGTPALSRLINVLFHGRIHDSNSGFRAIPRQRFDDWQIASPGMEITSELIVNCLKAGHRIAEVPINFRRDHRGRPPHLRTWRDGMRNLLFILSRAPHAFTYVGLVLLALSATLAVPASVIGPVMIGRVGILDFHTMMLAIFIGFTGAQTFSYGLVLDAGSRIPLPINARLLGIQEVLLLKLMAGLILITTGFIGAVVVVWSRHGFNNIHYLRPGLAFLYLCTVLGSLGFGLFVAQIHRRTGLR